MKLEKVFHGSHHQGLKMIYPSMGTHQEAWIYAERDRIVSAAFITKAKLGAFGYFKGRNPETGVFCLCERYAGAFADLYRNESGSIYELAGETFIEGQTDCPEEVVSHHSLAPLCEWRIRDVERYLFRLRDEEKIEMFLYPDRPHFIPRDDEDLIWRAVLWSPEVGPWTWSFIKEKLPKVAKEARQCLVDSEALHQHVHRWERYFESDVNSLYESLDEMFPEQSGTWH